MSEEKRVLGKRAEDVCTKENNIYAKRNTNNELRSRSARGVRRGRGFWCPPSSSLHRLLQMVNLQEEVGSRWIHQRGDSKTSEEDVKERNGPNNYKKYARKEERDGK